MKEYLLLTFIAAVGIFGLLSIHHEVRASDEVLPYFDTDAFNLLPKGHRPDSSMISRMTIDMQSAWPDIIIEVNHLEENAIYYLDSGSGDRTIISDGHQVIRYQEPGKKLIKLLKENILIDAVELDVQIGQHDVRFASY
ncbi:MAG: hypothetical protein KDC53_23810 [Saprospiraceae bacterium]|nr:hypothetical protein [Saprospiraceae bacterium]